MPYAMSVIMSAQSRRSTAKPSQRKLLYTMYKMGLLTGGRTKSANIVGQTCVEPHGDAHLQTMVRLSKGYEALLTPFVDSKAILEGLLAGYGLRRFAFYGG